MSHRQSSQFVSAIHHPCIHSSLSLATFSLSSTAPLYYPANALPDGWANMSIKGRVIFERWNNTSSKKVQETVLVYLPYYHRSFALLFDLPFSWPSSSTSSSDSTFIPCHSMHLSSTSSSFVSNYLIPFAHSTNRHSHQGIPSSNRARFKEYLILHIIVFLLFCLLTSVPMSLITPVRNPVALSWFIPAVHHLPNPRKGPSVPF